MDHASTVAIINPKSANGRTAKAWGRVRSRLDQDIVSLETRAPDYAIELASAALKRGMRTVIAVGGDGTINEVVNGFFETAGCLNRMLYSGSSLSAQGRTSAVHRAFRRRDPNRRYDSSPAHAGDRSDADPVRVPMVTGIRYSINLTSFGRAEQWRLSPIDRPRCWEAGSRFCWQQC